MAESSNKSIILLRISLSALIVALIFLLLTNPKFNVLLATKADKSTGNTFINPAPKWRYDYWSSISVDDKYPIVHIRSGYKVIKETKDKLIVGWKYELVNASSKARDITIYYNITDSDGFVIGSGSKSKEIEKKSYDTVQGTLCVDKDNTERIYGNTWSISVSPRTDLNIKNKEKNRFDLAGEVLLKKGPWWLDDYLNYRFDDEKTYEKAKKDKSKWFRIAAPFSISVDEELNNIRKNLALDKYELPPWRDIKTKPEYVLLSKDQKSKLKTWLALQRDFGSYDAKKGRKFDFEFIEDFKD